MARTEICSWAALLLMAACGPKEPAEQPQAPSAQAPAASEAAPSEPASSQPPADNTESPNASKAVQGPDEPQSSVHQQCAKVCKVVSSKCSKAVAEDCELMCLNYEKMPKACEPHTLSALRCYETAKDLPCAAMAPETCRKEFKTLTDCQKAPDSFQVKAEEKKKLPDGWGVYDEGSFSVPAPGGMTKSSAAQETTWTATSGKVRYVVRKLPVPKEKLTPKSQLRLANEWLKPCTLKLKLSGHVEKADRSSMLYKSGCKDGSVREGQIFVTANATYIVGSEAPAGEKAEMETFVYGFTLK